MMDESISFNCEPLLTEWLSLKENNLHHMLWIMPSYKACFLPLFANNIELIPEELNLINPDQDLLLQI